MFGQSGGKAEQNGRKNDFVIFSKYVYYISHIFCTKLKGQDT